MTEPYSRFLVTHLDEEKLLQYVKFSGVGRPVGLLSDEVGEGCARGIAPGEGV